MTRDRSGQREREGASDGENDVSRSLNKTINTCELSRRQVLANTGAATTALGLGTGLGTTPVAAETSPEAIAIDGSQGGRTFDGIGAVSAGASSRLLYDYPEPERSQILDYLFKPGYGAELQLLKVEIGGDTNSTDGAEPSHMRGPDDVSHDRGYEWWLMKEAKKRNPEIELLGLEWGAPDWFDGGFWSQDNIDYLVEWLDCADKHGLEIDYLGGWNERGYEKSWYINLAETLESKYPDTQVVAADSFSWDIATDLANDPEFKDAVDVVGMHFICGHRSNYGECSSTETARELDMPLWLSENSAMGYNAGAGPMARGLNRMYIDAKVTSYMSWSAISAWYANLPIGNTGLMLAEWPWSGYYDVGKNIWAKAHTTQFTEPGWQYIDSACGYTATGASYVTLRSPDAGEFSSVVETLDATTQTTANFSVTGGVSADVVHVWSTDMRSDDGSDHFVKRESIPVENDEFSITMEPNHVYSLTTTTGQGKGTAEPDATVHDQLDVPYKEDFDSLDSEDLAPYFSDLNGAFAAAPAKGDRDGMGYTQKTTRQPIPWNNAGYMDPTTVFGDPRWWGNYEASTDFYLDDSGYVELLGRISTQPTFGPTVGGYHLQIGTNEQVRWATDESTYGNDGKFQGDAEIVDGKHGQAVELNGDDEWVAVGTDPSLDITEPGLTIEATIKPQSGVGDTRGAPFVSKGDDQYVLKMFDSETLQFCVYSPSGEYQCFNASVSDDWIGNWHHVAGVYDGSELRLYIDGELKNTLAYSGSINSNGEPVNVGHNSQNPERSLDATYDQVRIYNRALSKEELAANLSEPTDNAVLWLDFDEFTTEVKDGEWKLYSEDHHRSRAILDSGRADVSNGEWHSMALEMNGSEIVATLDDTVLTSVDDNSQTTGNMGLRASSWETAQFDDVKIMPAGPPEHFAPKDEMTATATSVRGFTGAGTHKAANVVDDRPESEWHSDPDEDFPQSVTVDLGSTYNTHGLTVQPRYNSAIGGMITKYNIYVSTDGTNFEKVDGGRWPVSNATKIAKWEEPQRARYVRLEAVEAQGCPRFAAAAEINVATTPMPKMTASSAELDENVGDLDLGQVPQSEMTATATSGHSGYEASKAIDGDCATMWHTTFRPNNPPLPESITLDLGESYDVQRLTYLPRQDGGENGIASEYKLYVSSDGNNFTEIASGNWAQTATTKTVTLPEPHQALYVRLQVVEAGGSADFASAAEINVSYAPTAGE